MTTPTADATATAPTTATGVAARAERVLTGFGQAEIDGLLVTSPEGFSYLSGFLALDRAGMLLLTPSSRVLMTDPRYLENAEKGAAGWEAIDFEHRLFTPIEPLMARLKAAGVRRLGVEARDMTLAVYQALGEALGAEITLVPTEGLVEWARAVKDAAELAAIRQAVRIADAAFTHLIGWAKPGMTEREVAWELERHMREHGADALSFETIVAAGPNAAIPHHTATDRRLAAHEPILIDMGARWHGYCSDITRTFCFGEPDARLREVWEQVAHINEAARAGVRAGMTSQEADAVARDLFGAQEPEFTHSLGHGIGLAIHEEPSLSKKRDYVLPDGCVVTIEPGRYIRGWGGVRIEDMGVLRADGFETFTAAPKPLML